MSNIVVLVSEQNCWQLYDYKTRTGPSVRQTETCDFPGGILGFDPEELFLPQAKNKIIPTVPLMAASHFVIALILVKF